MPRSRRPAGRRGSRDHHRGERQALLGTSRTVGRAPARPPRSPRVDRHRSLGGRAGAGPRAGRRSTPSRRSRRGRPAPRLLADFIETLQAIPLSTGMHRHHRRPEPSSRRGGAEQFDEAGRCSRSEKTHLRSGLVGRLPRTAIAPPPTAALRRRGSVLRVARTAARASPSLPTCPRRCLRSPCRTSASTTSRSSGRRLALAYISTAATTASPSVHPEVAPSRGRRREAAGTG